MAKQTKTIKCPQCGSTVNTQIKEDFYKCNSCSTQYYLDNDDINVNVTHRVENTTPQGNKNKSIAIVLIPICIVLVSLMLLVTTKSPSHKPDRPYGSVILDIPVDIKGKMYLLILSNSYKNEGSFYSFVDFDTKEVIKTDKLHGVDKLSSSFQDCNIRKFSNGDIYTIVKGQRLFKLDTDKMELRDITLNLVETDSLYRSGIANIDTYLGRNYGDCFKIITNMGKEYYYYPRIKQSFHEKDLYDFSRNMDNLRPDSKEAIKYVFTSKKWDNLQIEAEDETQLYKVVYQDNNGGPSNTDFSPKWDKVNNEVILKWSKDSRILSSKNLTPGRLYFNPRIFYADKDYLLVKVTATASKKSAAALQRINTSTGDVLWTIPLELENERYIYYFDRALHAGNRFSLKLNDSRKYLLVSDDGKEIKYFNLNE